MTLAVFKCENCGARVPPPPATLKMVTCEYCGNPGHNPFYDPALAAAAAAQAAPVAAPAAVALPTPGAATTAGAARARTPEDILRLAHGQLQLFDALFYAPNIPAKKEQGARGAYGALIPADEPILVLFDSTVFGGADDGFVVTPRRLGWKNIALDPKVVPWEVFDARSVRATAEEVQVMGDMIQIDGESALQPRLVQFLLAMGGVAAQAPAATAPMRAPAAAAVVATPARAPVVPGAAGPSNPKGAKVPGAAGPSNPKGAKPGSALKARVEEAVEEEEEEEEDEETRQSWIDDAHEMAENCFTRSASLHVYPNIPKKLVVRAFETFADHLDEEDTVVVIYDAAGGEEDDGFVATPWGFYWRNRGEDPCSVQWEDLDLGEVVLDDRGLTIEGEAVRIARRDEGLAEELAAFIEAMGNWAQG
jgi:hypothetical protein